MKHKKRGRTVITEYRGKHKPEKKKNKFLILLIVALITFSLLFLTLNYVKPDFSKSIEITKSILNNIISPITKSLTGLVVSEDINESEKVQPEKTEEADEDTNNSEEEEMQDEATNETSSQPKNITEEEPANETTLEKTNETLPEANLTNVTETNQTIINETIIEENITEQIPENITEANATIITTQYQAVLGQPVKWKKTISLEEPKNTTIKLPGNSKNINIKKINENEDTTSSKITGQVIGGKSGGFLSRLFKKIFRLTGGAIGTEETQEVEVELDDTATEYEIEYETPAPEAFEELTTNGKKIIIVGPENLHYENVLAFTEISEYPKDAIKLYRTTDGVKEQVQITNYKDTNENGLVNYIEWIVPQLSSQTYEIIIEITKAEHLDSNRQFISDIYNEVKELDDIWSETIPDKDYVRVIFEIPLDSSRDITIHPRIISGNPKIEVYEVDGTEILAEFTNIISNEYNKVFLTNLQGEQDSFDLRILDGSLEFDHIIDPTEGLTPLLHANSQLNVVALDSAQITAITSDDASNLLLGKAILLTVEMSELSETIDTLTDANCSLVYYTGTGYPASSITFEVYDSFGGNQVATSTLPASDGVDSLVHLLDLETTGLAASEVTTMVVYVTNTIAAKGYDLFVDQIYCTIDYEEAVDNPPQWFTPSVNNSNPLPNVAVRHNVNWTDDTALSYATLEVNSSGVNCDTTANVSSTSLSLANEWANLTWTIPNACEGKTIGWRQYANDSLNQWNGSMPLQTYTVENIVPTASFETDPIDTYNSTSQSITFELSCSDNLGVSTLQLWGNWTGIWHANQTNSSPVNDTLWSIQVDYIPEGKGHVWGVWCNDSVGNENMTGTNRTFKVDATAPSLIDEASNETEINQNEVFCLNITVTDSLSDISIVYAKVWNTGSWTNYTMNDTGTSCGGGSDDVYGVEIIGSNVGLWNYSKAYANDSLGNMKSYDFSDLTINVTAPADSNYPQFSAFTEYPNNDTSYSSSALNYKFNSTITFTNSTAGIDFGGINYSATNVSDAFTVSISNLAAGIYDYFWWSFGNGSNENPNSSSIRTYSVAKSSDSCSIYFNETSPLDYGNSFTVWTDCNTDFTLYSNGSSIDNNSIQNLGADAYNFTVQRTDTTNYTNYYDEEQFIINQATPVMNYYLNSAQNNVSLNYPNTINASASTTVGTVNIYRNGTSVISENNLEINLDAGYYEYIFNVTGNANYSDVSSEYLYFELNQSTSTCQVLFNETSPLDYGNSFTVWTDCNTDFTLYRNGTTINNNSIQFLGADAYNFTVQRTDTTNYTNYYDEEQFIINQATGEIATHIDNVRNNKPVLFNSKRFLNATLINGHTGSNIKLYYNNTLINQGTSPLSNLTNFTGEGVWNVSSFYDGNENYTSDFETWWVTVSTDSPPTLNIIYPANTTYDADVTQLNYTIDDDLALSHCWYSLNGGIINSTFDATCSNYTSLTANEGSNNWTVWANDSINQLSSEIIFFTKDTVYPNFTSYLRNPATPNEDQDVQVNITITETNIDKVILEWNSTTNYTITTSDGDEYYFTVLQGNYTAHDPTTYYWYSNDTAGNMNKSAQQSFTVANQIPSVSAPGVNNTTPYTNDLISCNSGTFSDNDAEDNTESSREFMWYENDIEISGQTFQTLDLTTENLDKGDAILCSIRVSDSYDWSSWVNSSNTSTIQNSAPTIDNPQTTVSWNANGSTYTYDYDVTDLDTGDSFTWYINTSLIGINPSTGEVSDTPTENEAGTYAIEINVSDGTVNTTDEFLYTINDVTYPLISVTYPIATDYTINISQLNYTFTETNVDKCWWSNNSGIWNSSVQTCGTNWTELISNEGSNTWTVYINDTSGNENSTSVTFNKDTAYPAVTINSPLNQNYNTSTILFNVTATDGSGISLCWYSLNSGTTNYSMTGSSNFYTNTNSSMNQGTHTVIFYCNDTLGNLNDSKQETFFIDSIIPTVSSLTESPNDPATYSASASYEFNATITDTNLNVTLIEFNGINYTPTNLIGNIYNLTISGLAVGNYNYYWYANDTINNVNSTGIQTYTINQATDACNVLFNETSPINYGTTFKVWTDCNPDFTLYRNGTSISNNSDQYLAAGAYNFTVMRTDSVNYSNYYDEEIFVINQISGNISLLINNSASDQSGTYGIQTNASAASLYGTVSLYRNSTDITGENNNFVPLAAGYYNYTAVSSGDQNHSSASITRFVDISKAGSEVNLTLNVTDGNITIVQDSYIWLNLTKITGDSSAILKLYKAGTLINQGASPLANYTQFSAIGIFNITGFYIESENYTGSYETWYVNVTEAPDLENPSVSSLTEFPEDNTQYNPETNYIFNATITDNRELNTVLLEFDGTNYTTSNSSNIFFVTISGLGIGNYNYKWYANDSSGNTNYTETGSYTVNLNTSSCNVYVNESSPVEYGTPILITTDCTTSYKLYLNGSEISNNSQHVLAANYYNISVLRDDGINYTNIYDEELFTINKSTISLSLNAIPSWSEEYGTETNITGSNCSSQVICNLYKDGINITNPHVSILGVGTYNYTYNTTGNENYTEASISQNLTISKATAIVYTYINNSRDNLTIEQYTEIYLNGTLETGQAGDTIKLYKNGTLINQGTSPLSNLTNFTIIGLYNITTVYDGNENYTSAYETFFVNVTELDVTAPNIQIVYPENTSYDSVQTQLNYTASDNFALNACWYSLNNGVDNTSITCGENVTGLNSNQGTNTWKVWANDSKGNENSSSVSFFVDSINPAIEFVEPTNINGLITGKNYIEINVSTSDDNLENITIRLHNSTGALLRENRSSADSFFFINYTGLSADTYYFNATANDSLGNENYTETRNITLIKPVLTIIKPENETYVNNVSLLLNYSATYADTVWYNLDLVGENVTITSPPVYFNATEGQHILYFYANNSNGESVENITFTINLTKFIIYYEGYKIAKKGESTNFNIYSYEDIQNLSNILLENADYGKIEFNEIINLTDDGNPADNILDLDNHTNISFNRIELNSTALPNFNKTATLYLYNLTFSNPRILRNGVVCPDTICTEISYSTGTGTLIFNATGFSVYSAEEIPSETPIAPSGGGGRVDHECTQDSDCEEEDQVCLDHTCVKLFDIKIINFESPVKLGEFFEFTYLVKGMTDISGDVEVLFWIEKQGESVTSGSDVIYLGSFEEKIETTKIFLPSTVDSGVYQFFVKISYDGYTVQSHRTIEIEVTEGVAEITPIDKEPSKKFLYYLLGILALAILIVLIKIIRRINWQGLNTELGRRVSRYRLPRYKLPSIDYAKIQRKIELRKKLRKVIESIKIATENSLGYLNKSFEPFKSFKLKIKKKPKRRYKPKEQIPKKLEVPEPEIKHEPEIPEHLHILKKKYAEEIVEETKKEPKELPPAIKPTQPIKPKEPLYKPVVKEEMQKPQDISKEPQPFKSSEEKPAKEESTEEKPTEDTPQDIIESMVEKEEDKKLEE